MEKKIILASQSPRRKQLLKDIGIDFEIQSADIEEDFPEEIAVYDAPLFIAKKKAMAIAQKNKDAVVIAADTVVILQNQIIGKPKDKYDAKEILKKLLGKKHDVVTGVVIIDDKNVTAINDITEVYFKQLSDTQIDYYIEKYKPFDKAGAYAIQEWIGMIGIEKISGDYYNVMGLPVNKVADALSAFTNGFPA